MNVLQVKAIFRDMKMTYNFLWIVMLPAFSNCKMQITFYVVRIFKYWGTKILSMNFLKKVIRIFFFNEMRTTFSSCPYYFSKECCPHFFPQWNADNIFGLSAFSKCYPDEDFGKTCCPHFLLMKCGQHF